jgi:hypothetical protein
MPKEPSSSFNAISDQQIPHLLIPDSACRRGLAKISMAG